MSKMKVLFVCWGNICRSPLAHGVALYYYKYFGSQMQFDSCGMYGEPEGQRTHEGSYGIINEKLGISFSKASRHWKMSDYQTFDLILCMDKSNYYDVISELKQGDVSKKVKMFRDYDPNGRGDVPDPYYVGGFDKVYDIIERTVLNIFRLEQKGTLE